MSLSSPPLPRHRSGFKALVAPSSGRRFLNPPVCHRRQGYGGTLAAAFWSHSPHIRSIWPEKNGEDGQRVELAAVSGRIHHRQLRKAAPPPLPSLPSRWSGA
ncbi:hypothetical protein L1987_07943 [Smallanthus sonchifolius]|uniref:Uncharacterized protein n=1 Tax=Smallanthus sonchifolius TaxID=185202 RepID=A0ACB9JJT8_9ASTR|nr:hypothetical protein L1987_07943 [Smallanthus sonchifolius]